MKFDYQLNTDSGCSTVWECEFLIPAGTTIWHEYGLYKVVCYIDDQGNETKVMANIHNVICEKVYGKTNK